MNIIIDERTQNIYYYSQENTKCLNHTTTMASFLANGIISGFSPKPTYDSHKLPKGFHPKPQIPNFPNLKTLTSRLFKVWADVGYSGQGTSSNLSSSALGKSSISTTTTTTTPSDSEKIQEILRNIEYNKKFGFNIDIDSYSIPKGLSKETIRLISLLKEEPDWMLEFRLNAYEKFLKMKEPKWSGNQYPLIDFQDICYYSEFLYSFMIFLSLIFLCSLCLIFWVYMIFFGLCSSVFFMKRMLDLNSCVFYFFLNWSIKI